MSEPLRVVISSGPYSDGPKVMLNGISLGNRVGNQGLFYYITPDAPNPYARCCGLPLEPVKDVVCEDTRSPGTALRGSAAWATYCTKCKSYVFLVQFEGDTRYYNELVTYVATDPASVESRRPTPPRPKRGGRM